MTNPLPPTSAAADELVAIVDRNDRIVGGALRARMRAERLRHRASFIFVFRSDGRLLVQRRTTTKDLYPGYWDLAAGGVVLAGESYEQSARREAYEELRIEGVPIEERFRFYFEDAGNRCFGAVSVCRTDGPFVLQASEVEHVEPVPIGDILEGRLSPVTPDSLLALRKLLAAGGAGSVEPPVRLPSTG